VSREEYLKMIAGVTHIIGAMRAMEVELALFEQIQDAIRAIPTRSEKMQ
jgi:hypothetical protein